MSGSTPAPTPVLMLSTIHAGHAQRSGYGRLASYVAGAEFIHAPRADPKSAGPLFAARVARRFAFSRWYLGGSASLEWQAFRRIRAGFAGVVHSMWADHDLGYLDLLIQRPRQRLCGTFHNCPDDFRLTIRFPSRLRKFDAIVLMSECQRPFFQQAGVADERIHVILHGVDTEYFRPAPQIVTDGPFTVFSAGGYRRNFPLLRSVCERLLPHDDIRFEIAAPADFRPLFADLPNTRFSTGLDDAELLAKYQTSSCLLHTTEQATANNVLVESLACGLPIVAERIGGIPEYATGDSAVLTPPRDPEALAEAIQQLARSSSLRQQMSIAARERAEELSWPRVAERMAALYRSL